MSLFTTTLYALLPLFLLVLLGYGLKKLRVLHPAQVPVLNGLVVNVTLPALIIKGLLDAPHLPASDALAPIALLAAEAATFCLAFAAGFLLRLPRPTRGAMLLTGTFGNTSFLGYPIALALLPHFFPVTILLDQFGMTIALYLSAGLIGAQFGESRGEAREVRQAMIRFLRSPIFMSLVVGLALHLITFPALIIHAPVMRKMGGILMECLGYVGQGTTPVVLLALGVALRPETVRAYVSPILFASALKLLVCPAAIWIIARSFGLHGGILATCVLSAAMPTSVMSSVLSGEHDLAGDYAVAVVFASTVLSAVTIPLLLSVLR